MSSSHLMILPIASKRFSVHVHSTRTEAASDAARRIATALAEMPGTAFGVATGQTPVPVYEALAQLDVDWDRRHIIALDEYLVAGNHPSSFSTYVASRIAEPFGVPQRRVHVPRGDADDPHAEARRFEELVIGNVRGVQLLGIGENGHIGFNEPGSAFSSTTRVVTLSRRTRQANRPHFAPSRAIPRHAITQGISTILRSQRIVLVAFGAAKAAAISAMLCGPIHDSLPASALRMHPSVDVVLDREAAGAIGELD